MTYAEIIKHLEVYSDGISGMHEDFDPGLQETCVNAIDFINRQKAEIERLTAENILLNTNTTEIASASFLFEMANQRERAERFKQKWIAEIKAEAYKEFYEKLHTEILAARDSNFKAKEERIAKSKEYGIPIDIEDNFLMYCDGKIHALDGIDYFAYETLKETVGDNDA